ncbi:MAG: acetate--CoA ligase family protein, partial [Actinomycetota bacterium]
AIHDSGGERAHLIDIADDAGVRFADISEPTRAALAATLEPGLPAVNPLDAWGTGTDFDSIFYDCMSALLDDDDTAALAFVVDLKRDDPDSSYVGVATKVFESTAKPFAVVGNLASAIDPDTALALRNSGVPVLEDTAYGLAAFAHLFAYRDHRGLSPARDPAPVAGDVVERWRKRLAEPEVAGAARRDRRANALSEAESLALVGDYGIPVAATSVVSNRQAAVEAARAIGLPVALKSSERLAHKSDAGAVLLGLPDEAAVAAAYDHLAARFGPRATVQAMAPPGVELALGIVNDEQFGPLVLAAAGGVLVELLDDRALALPPLDTARARRLVDRLQVRRLLDGPRGTPPADVGALDDALLRLSRIALDLGRELAALDVNPLICGPGGCVAVDALAIPALTSSR